jgi:predicted component of type VI protein secretion system
VAGAEGQVELGFGEIYIGRAVECAIRTDDPLVSRRHARIYFQNGTHVIEDLGSANGIYIGDNRTQMHTLQNGDNVRAGNLYLRYMSEQPAFAAPMASPMPMGGATPSGTQILNVNEPFINPAGSGAISRDDPMMSPPMPPMTPPSIPGGGVTPLSRPPMPSMAGMPMMGGTSLGGSPYGAPPPAMPPSPSPFGATQMHPGVMGGPPPPMPGPSMPGPPPAMPSSGRGGGAASGGVDAEEALRMQRRIDQLASELRMMRGGGDKATRMEELEERITRLERDNRALEERANELKKLAETASGGDMGVSGAKLQLSRAEEVIIGLNDVLSELRINVLAAEGEVERFAHILPQASFELVRESLRSSRMQMDSARDWMRMLRDVR